MRRLADGRQLPLRSAALAARAQVLAAVKLAIALNRAVSLRSIAEHPVLGDMAELLHRVHAEEPLASADGN